MVCSWPYPVFPATAPASERNESELHWDGHNWIFSCRRSQEKRSIHRTGCGHTWLFPACIQYDKSAYQEWTAARWNTAPELRTIWAPCRRYYCSTRAYRVWANRRWGRRSQRRRIYRSGRRNTDRWNIPWPQPSHKGRRPFWMPRSWRRDFPDKWELRPSRWAAPRGRRWLSRPLFCLSGERIWLRCNKRSSCLSSSSFFWNEG